MNNILVHFATGAPVIVPQETSAGLDPLVICNILSIIIGFMIACILIGAIIYFVSKNRKEDTAKIKNFIKNMTFWTLSASSILLAFSINSRPRVETMPQSTYLLLLLGINTILIIVPPILYCCKKKALAKILLALVLAIMIVIASLVILDSPILDF